MIARVLLAHPEPRYKPLPIAQAAMLDQPSRKTMIIGLLSRFSLFIVLAQFDKLAGLFHAKALVQEGINEQIHVLLHALPPLDNKNNNTTTQSDLFDNCVVWPNMAEYAVIAKCPDRHRLQRSGSLESQTI